MIQTKKIKIKNNRIKNNRIKNNRITKKINKLKGGTHKPFVYSFVCPHCEKQSASSSMIYITYNGLYQNLFICLECYDKLKKEEICGICSYNLMEHHVERYNNGRGFHYNCIREILVQQSRYCFCECIFHQGDLNETFPITSMIRIDDGECRGQYACRDCYDRANQNYEVCGNCKKYIFENLQEYNGICYHYSCMPQPPIPVNDDKPPPLPPIDYEMNPGVNFVERVLPLVQIETQNPNIPINVPVPVVIAPELAVRIIKRCDNPKCLKIIKKNAIICPFCTIPIPSRKALAKPDVSVFLEGILKTNGIKICQTCHKDKASYQEKCKKCFRKSQGNICRACGKSLKSMFSNHKKCQTIFFNKEVEINVLEKNFKKENKIHQEIKHKHYKCDYCDEYIFRFEDAYGLYDKDKENFQKPIFYVHKLCYNGFCQAYPDLLEKVKI